MCYDLTIIHLYTENNIIILNNTDLPDWCSLHIFQQRAVKLLLRLRTSNILKRNKTGAHNSANKLMFWRCRVSIGGKPSSWFAPLKAANVSLCSLCFSLSEYWSVYYCCCPNHLNHTLGKSLQVSIKQNRIHKSSFNPACGSFDLFFII